MRSLILHRVARAVLPVTTLFAIYLLLRGHNEPGGGFIAGLVTASGVLLQGLAFGVARTRQRLGPLLRSGAWTGLALAAVTGLAPVLWGLPFLTHGHTYLPVPGGEPVHLSTTLVFDVGVYMAVVGVTATLMSVFAEAAE